MALPKLINDNTLELLESEGRIGTARPAKDDVEFFTFLKDKVVDDFNRMLELKDVNKKIAALADLRADIDEYVNILRDKEYFVDGMMKERQEIMGGFDLKLILEKVDKKVEKKWGEEDYEMVIKSGEEDGYPAVNLRRNEEGKVYTRVVSGKEAWEKQLEHRLDNDQVSQDNFLEFVGAVLSKDYDKEV
jgi:predicted house-cleaning noncanonical NTP pyrophosphatase (MazG superfamily)